MYQILEFTQSYLLSHDSEPFYKFVNKAYDKPKFKFQVIKTRRIITMDSFNKEMSISSGRDFRLYVLLGPKTLPPREFKESFSLEEAFEDDVDLVFDPSNVEFVTVDDEYDMNNDLYRVLGSVGYSIKEDTAYMTAFTSYIRNLGPNMINLTIPRLSQFNVKGIEANCVREHQLFTYYTEKCGFQPSGQPDDICKVGKSLGSFSTAVAYRDFSVAFIYRPL
ncbi:hypothetical protein CLIB1444_03S05512 [[Candida] jaroonii]|uniref:Uncharacterized protein n=1 Tax=[Candida] jaroonii TaxID=467808 RepID=A0ACA9Y596_9ASCO|nr:hypothetical protein CLIB1444_03S05512 [[Candida] jaroonii]